MFNNNNDNNNNNQRYPIYQNNDDDDDDYYIWNGLENVQGNERITRVRVDDDISVIPPDAFRGCINLRDVQLPVSLLRLERYCFANCISLTKINLPASLQDMDQWSFWKSGLERIHIPPHVTHLQLAVFQGCESLMNVIMHENITNINENAFTNCDKLQSIQFPSSLRSIGSIAFLGSGLKQIELPTNVNVHDRAFHRCYYLTTIILPKSMGTIGNYVFAGCPNISEIRFTTTTTATTTTTTTDIARGQQPLPYPVVIIPALEQKLLFELCSFNINDGVQQSAIDRVGMGWHGEFFGKDYNSTVQITCLFTWLTRNSHHILK